MLRKLELRYTAAVDMIGKLIKDADPRVSSVIGALPKLQDAIQNERDWSGLEEDNNLRISFVEPEEDDE